MSSVRHSNVFFVKTLYFVQRPKFECFLRGNPYICLSVRHSDRAFFSHCSLVYTLDSVQTEHVRPCVVDPHPGSWASTTLPLSRLGCSTVLSLCGTCKCHIVLLARLRVVPVQNACTCRCTWYLACARRSLSCLPHVLSLLCAGVRIREERQSS